MVTITCMFSGIVTKHPYSISCHYIHWAPLTILILIAENTVSGNVYSGIYITGKSYLNLKDAGNIVNNYDENGLKNLS